MHDAGPVGTIMRRSIGLLLLVAVGACGSTATPGPDGGGGSSAGGAGGITGAGGRGGGSGGAAGSAGGRGGAGACAPNQVWCPGCEPGTGACYPGGCPGIACPPPDGGAGGASGSGGSGGTSGGFGGTGGSGLCGSRACTSSELCVHPSCGGAPPQCIALPDGGQCPTGWTYRAFCSASPTQGPGCEQPPCTPPAAFCTTRPASCGT